MQVLFHLPPFFSSSLAIFTVIKADKCRGEEDDSSGVMW